MITATTAPSLDTLSQQLEAMAQALATANAQNADLARQNSSARWENPALVWPLFAASLIRAPA